MTGWDELVTTALLGTSRRPVPHDLPVAWAGTGSGGATDPAVLLDLAAAHRIASRAGHRAPTCPAPEVGPAELPPRAPEPAQDLLGALLVQPQPGLVNLWLARCAAGGWGAGAEHWAALATTAARSTAVERPLLAAVLGPRGQWFLRQRAEWARLLIGATAPAPPAAASPAGPSPAGPAAAAEVAATAPGSGPRPADAQLAELTAGSDLLPLGRASAALELLGSGALGRASRSAGVLLGARLPPAVEQALPKLAEHYLEGGGRGPAYSLGWVRDGWRAMELGLQTRREIEVVFSVGPAAASVPVQAGDRGREATG